MREEYIKKVKKQLTVSRKQKYEILRDLNEAFDSATEHGETEKQVIERLGTPKDFAENLEEMIRFNRMKNRKIKKNIIGICCSSGMVIFFLISALLAKSSVPSGNIIGQADAITTIIVKSAFPINIFSALLIIGFIFLIITIVLIVGLIRKNK